MGLSFLKIKVRPNSTEIDLNNLKQTISDKVEKLDAKVQESLEEEMAFGMKALVITVAWPEEKESFVLEQTLEGIEGVSSIDVLDHRRAFG
jgi:translation elongation factor aEF-1 beta